MQDAMTLPQYAVRPAPAAMSLPTLGTWHNSSQDLRAGLFVQELLDGALALAEACILSGWPSTDAELVAEELTLC